LSDIFYIFDNHSVIFLRLFVSPGKSEAVNLQ